ncbi:multidrug transporter [Lysinibacillus yapensis]|uniref:Multidrug transporter n=1 Tax=Ureibacillus yapensis TaxID=2304605 RepID=A0A396SJI9_9BACL|nr:multidrug transporter [Lysinibacillus yapensis]RHW34007.1 multidrug transporter [Lysinibacillus yapensis]
MEKKTLPQIVKNFKNIPETNNKKMHPNIKETIAKNKEIIDKNREMLRKNNYSSS